LSRLEGGVVWGVVESGSIRCCSSVWKLASRAFSFSSWVFSIEARLCLMGLRSLASDGGEEGGEQGGRGIGDIVTMVQLLVIAITPVQESVCV